MSQMKMVLFQLFVTFFVSTDVFAYNGYYHQKFTCCYTYSQISQYPCTYWTSVEWKCPIQNPLLPCYKLRGFYTPCHTDKDCLNFYSISKCCYSPCLRINVCQIAVPYAIKHPQTCCNTITSTTTNTPILLSTTTTEEPTEKSAEVSTEEPTEMATIQPTAEPTEKLIQETTEEPIEKTTQPIQQETEESTEPSEEETDEVTDEPTTVEPITTEPTSPQTTTVDIPTPA